MARRRRRVTHTLTAVDGLMEMARATAKLEGLSEGFKTVASLEAQHARTVKGLEAKWHAAEAGVAKLEADQMTAAKKKAKATRTATKKAKATRTATKKAKTARGKAAVRAYGGLDLHPRIAEVASPLYIDRYFRQAILEAMLALEEVVKEKSGLTKAGDTLMGTAFSKKNPVLKLNRLADESDENEQEGFMWLMKGAVKCLRNPRAHKRIKDDPETALEWIAFISLLAKRVDTTTRSRRRRGTK